MKQIDISVNICTYNRSEMLGDALRSVMCQETDNKFSFEIVVVDNVSTDSTKAVVQHVAKDSPVAVRYVFEKAKGVAQARNRGIKESQGAWIAFFDDDQIATANWLGQLYEVAVKTGAQCVGGAVHLDLPAEQLRELGYLCRRVLQESRPGDRLCRYQGRDFPGSGNMLVARAVFDSIGLFDCSMVRGGSDWDFGIRARRAGFDMWYTSRAVIRHRIPPNRLMPEHFRYYERKNGAVFADYDFKYKGLSNTVFFCIARIGQAILINLPLLFFGWVRRDRGEVLGRICLLWRAEGYTRRTLSCLAPAVFPQNRFLDSLEFRKKGNVRG